MAVVIIHQPELGIVELTAPLDGLSYIALCGYGAIGGVGVGGADVAVGIVEFTDVFGEVPAVGVPGAVFLDGQRAGSRGLCRIPEDVPERRVCGAGEVAAGDL